MAGARMKFAERYPTEAELATAVASFRSWTELRERGLKRTDDDAPVNDPAVLRHSARLLSRLTGWEQPELTAAGGG